MSREEAISSAAFSGVVGLVLLSVGSFVASQLASFLGLWLGAIPTVVVWLVFAYYGMKQFASGAYTIVHDVHGAADTATPQGGRIDAGTGSDG